MNILIEIVKIVIMKLTINFQNVVIIKAVSYIM